MVFYCPLAHFGVPVVFGTDDRFELMGCSKCERAADHERCGAMMAARAALVGNFSFLDPSWADDGGDACQWPGVACTAVDFVPYRNVTKAPVVVACGAGEGYSVAAEGCVPCAVGTWNNGSGDWAGCVPWSVLECPGGVGMLNGTNSSDSRCRNPLTEAVCGLEGVSCDGWGTILGGAITGMYVLLCSTAAAGVALCSHRRRWCCTLLPRPPLVLHFAPTAAAGCCTSCCFIIRYWFYYSVLVLFVVVFLATRSCRGRFLWSLGG